MRSIRLVLALIGIFLFVQHSNGQTNIKKYDSLWKKVDDLVSVKGLPKSALTEVDKIYLLAKKEHQQAQLIRALIYRINLKDAGADGEEVKHIKDLEKEVLSAAGANKAILTSILAEGYWNYFQQNRWNLYNRTTTVQVKKDDIATWEITDFHEHITGLYLSSIKDEKLLKETKLEVYEALITKGTARNLRPTLYDLLTNRALEYFRNDERDITDAADKFEITQASAFDPATDFFSRKLAAHDTLSMQYRSLLLYQKLIAFHLYDRQPDALIDIDLQRIQFVREKAVMENKEDLYYMIIKHIADQYQDTPAAAQAWYLLAKWYADKAADSNTGKDTANRKGYLIAEEICERVMAQNKKSEGRTNCMNLLNSIRRKEMAINTEKVNIPGQPFRSLVTYRNIKQIYCRVIPFNTKPEGWLNNDYDDKYWQQAVKLTPVKTWSQALPDPNDHCQHMAEIKIDALPVGNYLILTSADEKFTVGKNQLALQRIYVSAISFVNNEDEYFVLHRESGKPLAGADVQVWNNYYDYKIRKNNTSKAESLRTDSKGYFRLKDIKGRNGVRVEIDYEKDHLFTDESNYSTYYAGTEENTGALNYEKDNARVFLFSDRSIYRPGQTLYFKGIAITKDLASKQSKIVSGKKTKIFLANADGERVDSVELTTSEYGSYSGKFRLPGNALNGAFTLRDDTFDATLPFSVEEYKRPKFYVEYDKLKGTFKVNDSITITGFAKAYAGNNIDGAAVKYRVVRTPRFIYPWLFGKRGMPFQRGMEITNGTAATDADGKFTVTFKAIPDNSIDKKLDPVFSYQVIADITDNNGETRSGETAVSVSYKALLLKISLPAGESIPADSLKAIFISTQNTNNEFEPALVTLRFYKLQQPERLIRSRFWDEPDQFVMSREEYVKLFPHDEYSNEKSKENWPKAPASTNRSDTSRADGRFILSDTALAPGWYLAEATTVDKYGSPVTDKMYIRLYDKKSNKLPEQEYITSSINRNIIQPGEQAAVTLASAGKDLTIIEQVQRNNQPPLKGNFNLLQLNNETKTFDYAATESDRGGMGVNYFFVKDNRFYSLNNNIMIPWTNKELAISYETYRDKTLPGSEEKWKLKISGSKKEKVAAEMLLSMYDASLDQFKEHTWSLPDIWETRTIINGWAGNSSFGQVQSRQHYENDGDIYSYDKSYDQLNTLLTSGRILLRGMVAGVRTMAAPKAEMLKFTPPTVVMDENISYRTASATARNLVLQDGGDLAVTDSMVLLNVTIPPPPGDPKTAQQPPVQIRTNFNETAFFFPDLHTDEDGNISFSFTMPEALTRWKLQGLAHTKELQLGYTTTTLITQKELMVQPNAPRFIREGDRMLLSAKVVNLSAKEQTGTIDLQLLDAATMNPVDGIFHNMNANQYFTIEAGKSTAVNFTIEVPYQYNSALLYRFIARAKPDSAGNTFSDGEEASLPVLTNSMLITESMPLPVRGNTEKKFSFTKLLQSGSSETLKHYGLTVEFTSNPAWSAVQSLPYLMEYPYDCAEQTFNRFYANALAAMIANSSPKLKQVFEQWRTQDTAALISNLQKNEELKSILLEETPWVLAAKTESQQKKNLSLLFDMLKMEKELNASLDKLMQMQSSNGGFVWFKGGPDDRYMTQYIITGIGHLKKLKALPAFAVEKINGIVKAALPYLEARMNEDYKELVKSKTDLTKNQLSYSATQFLYMHSFFPEYGIGGTSLKAVSYYRAQSQKFWLQQNRYMQGMTALHLFRSGDKQTAAAILKSLKENAAVSEEMGMYWADNVRGYFWHQAPVETQSLLIEAFGEISGDNKITGDLKTWLLKQKQTNNWRSTKATAEACYALLLQGNSWLTEEPVVSIRLGDKIISSGTVNKEEGTGYFKTSVDAASVKPAMGNITVKVSSQNATAALPSWGAVYWQYFETLENITPSATPLKLEKKLFIEKNSDKGPVLVPVQSGQMIKVGDKIKVRIELRVDRDMEYVHMKDMRAACMEPVNVLSGYKWQGGLGYYESTKDASTNFFFSQLRKGTYVFEYPLFATMAGNFSNGVTSIQCMYAPEFASHSEGIRVNVE